MNEDEGSNLDVGPNTAKLHDDVASDTSFQTTPADPTTTAMFRAEIKSTCIAPSPRCGRGSTRGGRGRAAKQQSTTKTKALSMSQPVFNDVA